MSAALANASHGSQDTGENRTVTDDFAARLDDVSNSSDTDILAGPGDSQRCVGDAPVFEHKIDQCACVNVKDATLIAEVAAQAYLLYGKFSEFKSHKFECQGQSVRGQGLGRLTPDHLLFAIIVSP
jgi:hypothetical protein